MKHWDTEIKVVLLASETCCQNTSFHQDTCGKEPERKMLLSESNAMYIHTLHFGMNLDKEKTTEVKGWYQKRKGIILWLRETVIQKP